MKSFAIVALIVVTSALPGLAQGTLPQAVQSEIDQSRKACLPDRAELLAGFVSERDVNGDGRNDYVLDYGKFKCGDSTTFFCGSAGCLVQIFVSAPNGSYSKVLDENVRRLRFAKLKGRPAILLDLHGSACGRTGAAPCAVTMIWNGIAFTRPR